MQRTSMVQSKFTVRVTDQDTIGKTIPEDPRLGWRRIAARHDTGNPEAANVRRAAAPRPRPGLRRKIRRASARPSLPVAPRGGSSVSDSSPGALSEESSA